MMMKIKRYLGQAIFAFVLTFLQTVSFAQDKNSDTSQDDCRLEQAWARLTVDEDSHPSDAFCDWFSGYFYGKTDIEPPDWWVNSIKEAHVNRNGIAFPRPNESVLEQNSAGVEPHKDRVRLSNHDSVVTIPKATYDGIVAKAKRLGTTDHVSFAIDNAEKYIVICVYSNMGTPFRMVCLDLRNFDLHWEKEIRAGGRTVVEGQGFQLIELKIIANQVVVFGVESQLVFSEHLSLFGGEPKCVFYSHKFKESGLIDEIESLRVKKHEETRKKHP